jgi:hypothetical protein
MRVDLDVDPVQVHPEAAIPTLHNALDHLLILLADSLSLAARSA